MADSQPECIEVNSWYFEGPRHARHTQYCLSAEASRHKQQSEDCEHWHKPAEQEAKDAKRLRWLMSAMKKRVTLKVEGSSSMGKPVLLSDGDGAQAFIRMVKNKLK